ncbi:MULTISPECIES: GntR family transcriptional regulator [Rhizobium]|uniref:GntR family transcriptional regulator n=1 Tax=Rhizobium TaxID=379 RepID=UPI0024B38BD8|nr:GntR family transcriptional regulator [Rhizobium sp. AN80A]
MEQATKDVVERRRGSGVKLVYDILRDEILDLKLAPGSPVDEVLLAERFQMSRTPIREALVRLAGEGLIETLPNRSTLVSNIDLLNLNTYFDALVLMYRVTTRLAAQNHNAADLVAIRQLHHQYAATVEARDLREMIAVNAAFHTAIAEAGRNPYFTGLFRRLLDEGRRILRLYYNSYEEQFPQRFVDEHDEIIAAIEGRDLEAADRLGKIHGEQIVEQVQRMFARNQKLDIAL